MPLITRRTQIAIETATAYGSTPSFSAADVVSTEIYDPVFTIQSEQFERNTAREFVGSVQSIPGSTLGDMAFGMDLVNLGQATAPPVDKPLKACGLTVTGGTNAAWVYTPSQTPNTFASAGPVLLYAQQMEDGRRKVLSEGMGTFTLTLQRGQPGVFAWQFQGNVLTAPTDAAIYSPVTRTTQLPLPFQNATVEWNGTAIPECVNSVTFDLGAEVSMLPCVGTANGYEGGIVTNFLPTISIEIDAPLVATDPIYTDYINGTLREFLVSFGGFTLQAFYAQITAIAEGDRNGVRINTLTLALRAPAYSASENRLFIMSFDTV
jgi:hypothetical protein